jgi:hypothetical protein
MENRATHSAIASFPAAAASLLAAASRLDASNDVTSSSAACSFSGFSVVAAALVVIVVVVLVVVVVFACPSRIAVVVAHVVVGTAFVTSANAIGIDRRRGDRLERAGGCLRAGGVCGDAGEICEALRSVLPPARAAPPFPSVRKNRAAQRVRCSLNDDAAVAERCRSVSGFASSDHALDLKPGRDTVISVKKECLLLCDLLRSFAGAF